MKICPKCKKNKEDNEFAKRKKADYRSKYDICSKCKQIYDKRRREIKREELSEKAKIRNKTPKVRAQRSKRYYTKLKFDKEWQRKQKARRALSNAIRDKKIVKPNKCSFCKKRFKSRHIQGHHNDYDMPLDVIWTCQNCHPS